MIQAWGWRAYPIPSPMVSGLETGQYGVIEAVRNTQAAIFGYAFFNPALSEGHADRDGPLRGRRPARAEGTPGFPPDPANSPLYERRLPGAPSRASADPLPLTGQGRGPSRERRCGGSGREVPQGEPTSWPTVCPPPAGRGHGRRVFRRPTGSTSACANAFARGVIEYAAQRLGSRSPALPFRMAAGAVIAQRLGLVCGTELSDEDKRKVLGGNMRRLIEAAR